MHGIYNRFSLRLHYLWASAIVGNSNRRPGGERSDRLHSKGKQFQEDTLDHKSFQKSLGNVLTNFMSTSFDE